VLACVYVGLAELNAIYTLAVVLGKTQAPEPEPLATYTDLLAAAETPFGSCRSLPVIRLC
jgi:hypothetical protein